jgi:hypothetical protein
LAGAAAGARLAAVDRPLPAEFQLLAALGKPAQFDDGVQSEKEIRSDRRWSQRWVRPTIWLAAFTILLGLPYVAREIEPAMDPLSLSSTFLVIMAAAAFAFAKLADA